MRLAGFAAAVAAASVATLVAQAQAPRTSGKATFESLCARCHGADGRGGEMGPGIVARVEASAGTRRYGGITRQGSPWVRWALVEVALRAMKRPDARGRWARRLAIHKGIKKARVALARRMCDEIVHTWQTLG